MCGSHGGRVHQRYNEGKGLESDWTNQSGVLHHPFRVDAHVVGHHVAPEAEAALPRALAQVLVGLLAAQVLRDLIIHQRVG